MSEQLRTLFLVAGLLSTGLMAGLLYGWLVSVIPGTARTDDAAYVQAMQQINVAIINPAFLLPFLATPLILAAAAFGQYRAGDQRRALTLATAAVVYLVGVLGVTIGGNVPLNNRLEDFELAGALDGPIGAMRQAYEGPWNRWHGLRTAASVLAFGLVGTAALLEAETA